MSSSNIKVGRDSMSRATRSFSPLMRGGIIRWIAFDAVGTLIEPAPPVHVAYHQVAARHGSRLTLEQIHDRWTAALQKYAESEIDRSSAPGSNDQMWTTSEERERLFWRRVVGTIIDDVDGIGPCFEELFAHFGHPGAWTCYPDAGHTLGRLEAAGYRLAVASNFDGRLNAICDGCPELRPLALRVISSEVGYKKPSPNFYDALLQATGARPDEILMVGNDRVNDVRAAREAGLQAVRIERLQPSRPPHEIGNLSELVSLLGGRSDSS